MSSNSGDIEQYTKWFDRIGMDFTLMHTARGWTCSAVDRSTGKMKYATGDFDAVSKALHDIYASIMRDIRNPF